MTLTAMSADFVVLNPSALIESGLNRQEVIADVKELQIDGLYCPHCYRKTGGLSSVRFRAPENRRVHFFHESGDDIRKCAHFASETEKHILAKSFLAERYRANSDVLKVEVDRLWLETEEGNRQKPDLMVIGYGDTFEAVEIQVSPISTDNLMKRTKGLIQSKHKGYHCSKVVWYLYGSNYSDDNRQLLRNIGADCYHLWYSDDGTPQSRLDTVKPPKSKKNGSSWDGCKEPLSEPSIRNRLAAPNIGDRVKVYQNGQYVEGITVGSNFRRGYEVETEHGKQWYTCAYALDAV